MHRDRIKEVDKYMIVEHSIFISVPRTQPYCQHCDFLAYEEQFKRYHCLVTGEWILNYMRSRGESCPINGVE